MSKFNGRVVLITGADSGLGAIFVERFLNLGARVILVARENHFDEIMELINSKGWANIARAIGIDLTEIGAIDRLLAALLSKTDHIDVLINNAGFRLKKELDNITESDWRQLIDWNMRVPFFLSQKVSLAMRRAKTRGTIINVASQLGIVAARDYSLYGISKAGLIGITKSLATELARYGISVNAVAPGPTNTAKAGLLRDETDVIDFLHRMPIARRVEPSEIADAVEFLAANPGGAVTGHTLVVDGGWTIT